ncbi:hypothetical protein TNCV_256091 [Trichonephila clavipes]|nr:hypothetical protein TNCV_256091 [Trichonephila clavipes]
MSLYALRKILQKFETTRQLVILPDRGRKRIPSSSIENVATADVETSSQSLDASYGSLLVGYDPLGLIVMGLSKGQYLSAKAPNSG